MTGRIASKLVWFITGTSSGFGREIALRALARGDNVIATARPTSLRSLDSLEQQHRGRCKTLALDVTDSEETIGEVAKKAVDVWGSVDVVVNNAGVGIAATLEEGGVHCMDIQLATNLLGPLKVTNAFLPHMRAKKSGTIIMMGSRSAWQTDFPIRGTMAVIFAFKSHSTGASPLGFYAASKAALHALSDTYAAELSPFNISVMCVQPGAFRTSAIRAASSTMLSPVMLRAPKEITDYAQVKAEQIGKWAGMHGREPGDPVKAAEVIVDLVQGSRESSPSAEMKTSLPQWLFLGSDCAFHVKKKCEEVTKSLEEWRDVSVSTDWRDQK